MADYSFLVADVIAACENDTTEFSDYVPKMVNRAEERLTKDLDDYGLVSIAATVVTIGDRSHTFPSGTRIVKSFSIVSNGSKINLLQRTDEYIDDYWPVSASTGEPRYYAHRNNTTAIIAPTPTSTYTGEVTYVARPVTLTSVNTTNYFTDFCYDLLFHASMVEAMMFQKDYATMAIFERQYIALLDLQRNQARRSRRDDMQTASNPAGADNPLIPNSN
jgi:hypothetical protein